MIMLCMRMATAYHDPRSGGGDGGGRKTQPVLFQVAAAASFQPSSTADCQVTRWRLMHRTMQRSKAFLLRVPLPCITPRTNAPSYSASTARGRTIGSEVRRRIAARVSQFTANYVYTSTPKTPTLKPEACLRILMYPRVKMPSELDG